MNRFRVPAAMVIAAGVGMAGGCGKNWDVERVEPEKSTEVDYRFNDEDARQIFQSMTTDCLNRPWLKNWTRSHSGQPPIIFLSDVRNQTEDYINTQLFTTQIQEELLNSGDVRIKAERDFRDAIREERLDTKFNDPETIKAVAKELNADFALTGFVNDNKQRSNDGRVIVNYYQANMRLIDVETAEIVWSQTKELKKVAKR